MPDQTSYAPADLLLFSARVYFRLIELSNEALWPAQLAALALGLLVLLLTLRGDRTAMRAVGILLGAAWIWVAWSFLWERFATINWVAAYIAPVFAVEGVLCILWALTGDGPAPARGGWVRSAGIALLAGMAILYPLVAMASGRPWAAAETFAIFPDPTAAATLAVLALAGRGAGWLMIVPALWCALSSETLWLLGAPDFFIPATAALSAILLRLAGHRDLRVHGT